MTDCTISRRWDGSGLPPHEHVRLRVSIESDLPEAPGEDCLVVAVESPFYNDPRPHPDSATHHLHHEQTHVTDGKGCLNFEGLWKFEVVELFIKGRSDKYIEIEMGPHGHYLILACDGHRQCFHRGIEPIHYSATISGSRWTGRMVCPLQLLPPPSYIPSAPYFFNAYAIHNKESGERVHCAAFPPAQFEETSETYAKPDFHKLELFNPLTGVEVSCHPAVRSIWDSRPYICLDMGAVSKASELEEGHVSPRE